MYLQVRYGLEDKGENKELFHTETDCRIMVLGSLEHKKMGNGLW